MVEIHFLIYVLYYQHPKYELYHDYLSTIKKNEFPQIIDLNNLNKPAEAMYDPLGEYFAHCTAVECSV